MNSERLKGILKLIPKSKIIVDIGTDHAYIPEAIIKRNIAKEVIGTEINPKPYLKAQKYIKDKLLKKFIEIRKGDGFDVIDKKELEIAIIAGMGGLLINRIIRENISKFNNGNTLILQPMNAVDKTRKFLDENMFEITDEILCKEDYHYYTIIKAKFNQSHIQGNNELDYITNEILFRKKDKYIEEFTNNKIRKNNIIIKRIEKNSSDKTRKEELKQINAKLKELLSKYEFKLYY